MTQAEQSPLPLFRYWVPPTLSHQGFFVTTQTTRFEFYQNRIKIHGVCDNANPSFIQRPTGKRDRAKNLLWEGDIVFFPYSQIYLAKILWSSKEGAFCLYSLSNNTPLESMYDYLHHSELLGHIHQYPELS